MEPLLRGPFANPSALHAGGREARAIIDHARSQVAGLLGCAADEVVFTSGGSEANNLALTGAFFALRDRGDHIVTTTVEHPATLEPARFLERLGARVTLVPVDRFGRVDPDDVRRAITPRTILVSVMHANNEVGTIEPIAEIGAVTRERGVLFHTDAAQSVGKIPTRVDELGVDLLSIAGHKVYAPKGVGALYIRAGSASSPSSTGRATSPGGGPAPRAPSWRPPSGGRPSSRRTWVRSPASGSCATGSGMGFGPSSARASSSTATPTSACRTRSTSRSSADPAPT